MDLIFAMSCAAYNRAFPDPKPFDNEAMNGPRGIQKLLHVALQVNE